MKDAKSELTADDRGDLHDPLETLFETVHPGGYNALDGVRNLDVGEGSRQKIAIILLLYRSVFEKGVRKLLHEERVAGCLREDQFPKLGDDLSFTEDGLDEFGTGREGELIYMESSVVGPVPPAVGILRPVEKDEEYRYVRKPADEVVQKLL